MDSTRQQKFSKLIQKELAEIFLLHKNLVANAFVTITGVRTTADLSLARIHLSIFQHKKPEEVINYCNEHMHEIRRELGNRIRHQARIIPELAFYLDDSLDSVERMDKLFKGLNIPPPDSTSES
ncbi:MAG: 30S ribosome-binding factor RbfA [Bacteroidia bacterium]|nr:30S ribosome-binding factor RbfA [Bacteroidia bacterium]MCZ2277052.1 30S ribosome-binding factor RbfA [Bacteroidia bacterium]